MRADELREQAKKKMAACRSEYESRIAELAVRTRRSAFGSAPRAIDGSAIIAWRDAQDRADRLERRDEAAAAMRRSLAAGPGRW